MLDIMLGAGIEPALVNPSTLIPEPWQASSEKLTGLGVNAMVVDPALVPTVHVLFLFCHLLATAHAAADNAASATPLEPSTALSTATVPPVPNTPGKSHLTGYCFIKDYIST
ncbi:unnamed protein product [Sphagnum troendelagicum]|uniref:Uncharacterized protein n=1 Tax=Sphagnum troendelagicum TaxID=128251 RepID=A0ABP0TBG5_9BRYO